MRMTPARPFDQRIRIGALRIGALILLPLLILIRPDFVPEGFAFEVMENIGILLIIACVLGRFWAILYVGRHKNRSVITDGPYSITRNPLYLFSSIGAFGIGLLFGKLSLALALGGSVFALLWFTARREADFLAAEFGPAYADYAARVPMFVPNFRLFRTAPTVEISTDALRRNLLDAFVFLSAIPIAELAETLYSRLDLLPFALP